MLKNSASHIRGFLLTMYLRYRCGCKVGKGLCCAGFPRWYRRPQKNVEFGDYIEMGHDIEILLKRKGRLIIHNHVNMGNYSVWAINDRVEVGSYSGVAAFSSIRDSNHGTTLGTPTLQQDVVCRPIFIGDDVWIGERVAVLMGSIIPDGCVIAANAVVLGKSKLELNCIYGGVPARLLKPRESVPAANSTMTQER